MDWLFLIWGMILITIFLVSDTIEDLLDSREKRRRRRERYRYEDWDIKD